jgi:3-phosphoshikimate 1-carboxyvinyltransferase
MKVVLKGCKSNFNVELILPGDKSIAHRALIIGTIPEGSYCIENYPMGEDCIATIEVVKKLGVSIVSHENKLMVNSPGIYKFNRKVEELNCRNSGTTARLISGVICGANIATTLIGDESLSKRPMRRIIDPLKKMGGSIAHSSETLPLIFLKNEGLKGIEYKLPVASAQVKSALLIAGFLANGITKVIEPMATRDHTERLFKFLGAKIDILDNEITISNSKIQCKDIFVPGDSSSSCFLVGCALLGDNIKLTIKDMLLNHGRIEYLKVLKAMGADIEIISKEKKNNEPIGDIIVRSSKLRGVKISKEVIPRIIDEIPVLSVLAAFSEGNTLFEGVEELKVKECDRVEALVKNFQKLNVEVLYENNNLLIKGTENSKISLSNDSIEINTFNDHRIAMAFSIVAMKLTNRFVIDNWDCTKISFPDAEEYFSKFINFLE